MKPYEEWIKDKEPQYGEDLTMGETFSYKEIYRLEVKLDGVKTWLETEWREGTLSLRQYTDLQILLGLVGQKTEVET